MVSAPDPAVTQPGVPSRWPHLPEPQSRKCQDRMRRPRPTARVTERAFGELARYTPGVFSIFLVFHSKTKRPQTREEAVPHRGRAGKPAMRPTSTPAPSVGWRLRARQEGTSVGDWSLRTFVPPALPWEEETPSTHSRFLWEHVSAKGDLALRSLGFPKSPVTSSRHSTYFARKPQPKS